MSRSGESGEMRRHFAGFLSPTGNRRAHKQPNGSSSHGRRAAASQPFDNRSYRTRDTPQNELVGSAPKNSRTLAFPDTLRGAVLQALLQAQVSSRNSLDASENYPAVDTRATRSDEADTKA